MAKQRSVVDSNIGKIKIRLVEFEVEGNDATLQESLKSISTALGRGYAATPRATRYIQRESLEPDVGGESHDLEGAEESEDSELVEVPVRKSSAPRKAKVIAYEVISDLRFDDVKPTLKEFAAEKKATI